LSLAFGKGRQRAFDKTPMPRRAWPAGVGAVQHATANVFATVLENPAVNPAGAARLLRPGDAKSHCVIRSGQATH
jgi:hypothetical protein